MRRVDHRIDALARKIRGEALGAAKAADAQRDRRRCGVRRRAGEREKRRDIALARDAPRERVSLRRAAKDQQAKALQAAAP
jgi:hypothetical protein